MCLFLSHRKSILSSGSSPPPPFLLRKVDFRLSSPVPQAQHIVFVYRRSSIACYAAKTIKQTHSQTQHQKHAYKVKRMKNGKTSTLQYQQSNEAVRWSFAHIIPTPNAVRQRRVPYILNRNIYIYAKRRDCEHISHMCCQQQWKRTIYTYRIKSMITQFSPRGAFISLRFYVILKNANVQILNCLVVINIILLNNVDRFRNL